MGPVQSTSEVVFLGMEMRGDWYAMVQGADDVVWDPSVAAMPAGSRMEGVLQFSAPAGPFEDPVYCACTGFHNGIAVVLTGDMRGSILAGHARIAVTQRRLCP